MKKATSPATTSGNSVTLTANSLNEYTNYYYYVTVSDGKGNPIQGVVQGPIRTYCPGNTYTCEGPFYGTENCLKCNGSGRHTHSWMFGSFTGIFEGNNGTIRCDVCGSKAIMRYDAVCRDCGYQTYGYACSSGHYGGIKSTTTQCSLCNGRGYSIYYINCSHGYGASHTYCEHNHTSQHD